MPKMAFILLFAVAFLVGCTDISKEPEGAQGEKGPVKELPLSEYKDSVVLDMYEGSRKSWVLRTRHLVRWPRTDLVKATPVDLVVFDSLGAQVVKVTADSGSVDEAINFLAATGRVHAHSAKGVDIRTDSLRWNKTLNQIHTEARVRVISEEGDTLTGRGFRSDAKLDNWQILADVKGVFQKVEERFQEADKPAGDTAARADSAGGAGSVDTSAAPYAPAAVSGAPATGPGTAVPDTGRGTRPGGDTARGAR
jgi:LPS export ABC transporter protein LptC